MGSACHFGGSCRRNQEPAEEEIIAVAVSTRCSGQAVIFGNVWHLLPLGFISKSRN